MADEQVATEVKVQDEMILKQTFPSRLIVMKICRNFANLQIFIEWKDIMEMCNFFQIC